jgi:hypothetical protein
MKHCFLPLVILFLLASVLLVGCRGTVTFNEKADERDKAVDFFKGAYPIAKEIREVCNDWNDFLKKGVGYRDNPIQTINICRECRSRLEKLQDDLSRLYALPQLRQLKSDIALSISTGISAFSLGEQCATKPEFESCNQADEKILELNRLIMFLTDEWDDGLAQYNIKPSEILQ